MSTKIDLEAPTYDRTTRTLYGSLEMAIHGLPPEMKPLELLAALQGFDLCTGRLCNLNSEILDIKEEIIADLRRHNYDLDLLEGDDYMKVDYQMDEIISEGFGAEMPLVALTQRVIKWMSEN